MLTAVVGGADKRNWIVGAVALPMAVLSAPVAQAADYWGRRWLLIGLTSMGFVGSLITSRCESVSPWIEIQSVMMSGVQADCLCRLAWLSWDNHLLDCPLAALFVPQPKPIRPIYLTVYSLLLLPSSQKCYLIVNE